MLALRHVSNQAHLVGVTGRHGPSLDEEPADGAALDAGAVGVDPQGVVGVGLGHHVRGVEQLQEGLAREAAK